MTELGMLRAGAVIALIGVGTFFLLVGTIGLLRLPKVYNRMHATTKATTLGAASLFLAGTVYFGPQGAGLTSLVGIVFLFLAAPTGAHVISRAAQKMGVDFEPGVTWPLEADVGAADYPTRDVEDAENAGDDGVGVDGAGDDSAGDDSAGDEDLDDSA